MYQVVMQRHMDDAMMRAKTKALARGIAADDTDVRDEYIKIVLTEAYGHGMF